MHIPKCGGTSVLQTIRETHPQPSGLAAYTAVDKAESDKATAHAVNAIAPEIIGEEAAKLGALVIHYSTDYVFDGAKDDPYVETDPTNPLSVYGRTKLDGEQALVASGARHLIFRTSWVFGAHGANFLKNILRLAREREELRIVADQFGAPTGAALIADVTAQLLGQYVRSERKENFPAGVFHLTASGVTSWHGYASHIAETAHRLGIELKATPDKIHAIPATAYPVPAARPPTPHFAPENWKPILGSFCRTGVVG